MLLDVFFIVIAFTSASFPTLHAVGHARVWESRASTTLHELLTHTRSNPVLSMLHIHESCEYIIHEIYSSVARLRVH